MHIIEDNRYKKAYQVESLREYFDITNRIASEENSELWYRGHVRESYVLLPNIMRNGYVITNSKGESISPVKQADYYNARLQFDNGNLKTKNSGGIGRGQNVIYASMLDMLEKVKASDVEYPYEVKNDLELIAMCQHHGLLTCFMDWTTDKETALFFATDKGDPKDSIYDENVVVYILNPSLANELCAPVGNPFSRVLSSDEFSDDQIYDYLNESNHTFICLSVPAMGYRIKKQDGRFTWYGYDFTNMDQWGTSNQWLYKIVITPDAAHEIKTHLDSNNITKDVIYGNDEPLDDMNKAIKKDAESKFQALIDKLNKDFFDSLK